MSRPYDSQLVAMSSEIRPLRKMLNAWVDAEVEPLFLSDFNKLDHIAYAVIRRDGELCIQDTNKDLWVLSDRDLLKPVLKSLGGEV